ncbi:MAG: hypothetical protein CMJ39_05475, partial [Phycisphaerae bacterium]|nr:hypothetical protein [Phycisphaerae bacterium]
MTAIFRAKPGPVGLAKFWPDVFSSDQFRMEVPVLVEYMPIIDAAPPVMLADLTNVQGIILAAVALVVGVLAGAGLI